MAERKFRPPLTQGVSHVYMAVKFIPNTAGVPTLGEGDKAEAYFTPARTGTGAFTLSTKNPYAALVSFLATVSAATQANWTVSRGAATQNSDNTWTIPFTIYDAGTATDLSNASGNSIDCLLVMRQSGSLP